MDFWVLLSAVLETRSADKAELAISQSRDRRRPWQSIDYAKVTDHRALGENGNYPLTSLGRPQADLEHTLIQPVVTVALVPGLKKRLASFQVVRRRFGQQLRSNGFGDQFSTADHGRTNSHRPRTR